MKQSPFTFSAEGKSIDAAASKIIAALAEGSGDPSFIFTASSGKLYLIGITSDAFVRLEVPNAVADKKESGSFALDSEGIKRFQGLLKGRAVFEFKFNGSECEYKLSKARYNGKIFTQPINEDVQASVENFIKSKGSSVSLPVDAVSILRQGTSMSSIRDVFDNKTILSYVLHDKKGNLMVSAFDDHHFSVYTSSTGVTSCEFSVALPSKYFAIIEKISDDAEEAKFQFNSGNVRVSSKSFLLVLPAVQAEEKHFTMAQRFIDNQGKPAASMSYKHSELQSVVNNLFTLFAPNSSFDLSAKSGGKTVNISISTDSGSAADALAVSSKKSLESFSASVEPRLFKDIVDLGSGLDAPVFEVYSRVVGFRGKVGDDSLSLFCTRSHAKGK